MRTLLIALLAASSLAAQIKYLPDRKVWLLNTADSTYAFGINERNELQTVYWGGRLFSDHDLVAVHSTRERASFDSSEARTPEEYPGWGGSRFSEPSLKITRANGDRDLVLKFESQEVKGNQLVVRVRDVKDDIGALLYYTVYPDLGIVEKHSVIQNHSDQPIVLESAQSGAWNLPPGDGYRLTYVSGAWAHESQLIREEIHAGTKVLESHRGNTSHAFNPWFMIDEGGAASEDHGRVWFGALGWSGNWRLAIEQTLITQARVTGGLNTFDFGYPLKPGESLETPAFYGGFSEHGFGGASRLMHRFERDAILPGGAQSRLRPVLYNSWEATTFKVDEPGQKALAAKAAAIGVELFVMDDGWFGARNDDHAGLGDWVVNKKKFPSDLQPLIAEVNRLGMDFGLWVEPEMVNPDSDLYRAHPDWIFNFPGRPRTELRNQMVLNLARPDVKEYVLGFLDRLASTYNVRYFKWDMNRPFSEPGWPAVAPEEEKKAAVEYVRNYYDIIDRLRARHPKLEIESCSGGGGRIDLGVLKRVEEVWTSDNTEAFDRLRIQEGFSYMYAPKIMSAWVTDVPNTNGRSVSLQYRFLVAMQGALGVGSNLNKFSDADLKLSARLIAIDKEIRATVQTGELYRLLSPREHDLTASQYVSVDGRQSVLFAFRHSQQFLDAAPLVHLRGLDPKATYTMRWLDGRTASHTGAWLIENGVDTGLHGDYDSTLVILEKGK